MLVIYLRFSSVAHMSTKIYDLLEILFKLIKKNDKSGENFIFFFLSNYKNLF